MNLYRLTQEVNNDYDTYDSCIVAAKTEDEARLIHPDEDITLCDEKGFYITYPNISKKSYCNCAWCKPQDVKVELLGIADKTVSQGVVLASFNAG